MNPTGRSIALGCRAKCLLGAWSVAWSVSLPGASLRFYLVVLGSKVATGSRQIVFGQIFN